MSMATETTPDREQEMAWERLRSRIHRPDASDMRELTSFSQKYSEMLDALEPMLAAMRTQGQPDFLDRLSPDSPYHAAFAESARRFVGVAWKEYERYLRADVEDAEYYGESPEREERVNRHLLDAWIKRVCDDVMRDEAGFILGYANVGTDGRVSWTRDYVDKIWRDMPSALNEVLPELLDAECSRIWERRYGVSWRKAYARMRVRVNEGNVSFSDFDVFFDDSDAGMLARRPPYGTGCDITDQLSGLGRGWSGRTLAFSVTNDTLVARDAYEARHDVVPPGGTYVFVPPGLSNPQLTAFFSRFVGTSTHRIPMGRYFPTALRALGVEWPDWDVVDYGSPGVTGELSCPEGRLRFRLVDERASPPSTISDQIISIPRS